MSIKFLIYCLFGVFIFPVVHASEDFDWVQYYELLDGSQMSHTLVHTPYYVCLDDFCSSVSINLGNDSSGKPRTLLVRTDQESFEKDLDKIALYSVRQSLSIIND